MDISQIKEDYILRNLYREARIMSKLCHPCIVSLFQTMQNGNTYYSVMELISGGDLCSFIKSQRCGKLDERNAKVYARQLISALAHMHNLGVVHRDLKMENVMINSIRTQIKIVDFGLSNNYDPRTPLRTHCGSPEYAAPELFVSGKSYGPEVDLWSLGVILFGMVVGQLPFATAREDNETSRDHRRKLLLQINKGYSVNQKKALDSVSSDFKAMISRMLVPDSNKRIKIKELLSHVWITDNGRKVVIVNPLKPLNESWQISIMKQIANLLDLDWTIVRHAINNEPQGDVGGIYNILINKLQTQRIEGDGTTKTVLIQPSSYVSRMGSHSITKETLTQPTVKKRSERIKSPSIHKIQKVSENSTPRTNSQKRSSATGKRPQTTAGAIHISKPKDTSPNELGNQKSQRLFLPTDTRNKIQIDVELNRPSVQTCFPREKRVSADSVKNSLPKQRASSKSRPQQRSTPKQQIENIEVATKSYNPLANAYLRNEVQVVGSKGISKTLLGKNTSKIAKPSSRSDEYSDIETSILNRVRNKSDTVTIIKHTDSILLSPAKSTKVKVRVIGLTGNSIVDTKSPATATPKNLQTRSRRVVTSKPTSNVVEQHPHGDGDVMKRRATSTTPVSGKQKGTQKAILSEPIARSIASYIARNMPCNQDSGKYRKSYTKPPSDV